MIRVIECKNVLVSDVSIEDSPMWVQHYLACDDVVIRGIRVRSRVNKNNDGIDIDCCQRVRISDCDIFSGDDAIVIKSTADRVTKDVTVTNCVLSTHCSALKLGTESNGGFENIVISNCTIYDTRLGGISLELVDGGTFDRVVVSNITMNGVGAPIFLRLGDRGRPFVEGGKKAPVGSFRNVIVSNVQAINCGKIGCAVSGLPGHCIEDVTLENLRLRFVGGGAKVTKDVPEAPDKYPEFNMFGPLPAYGFFFRHVRGLRMRNVDLSTDKPDERPAMVMEDTERSAS
jgi:polygalacturonase